MRCLRRLLTASIVTTLVACTMGRDVASEVSDAAVPAVGAAKGQAPLPAQGEGSNLMLFGQDPVACFTENRAAKGSPQHRAEHLGATYIFASAADRERSLADPSLTRLRRMVLRVPHYRSDASLQQEWEAMRDAGTLPVMPGQPQVVAR